MPHAFATAALTGAVLLAGFAPATATPDEGGQPRGGDRFASDPYRPLPPVTGTLRAGRRGLYGDRGYGPVRVRSTGPAVYDVRHRRGVFPDGRRARMRRDLAGAGYGYAPVDAGPANYAGQGFVPASESPGYGPVAYDQVGPFGGYGGTVSGGYGGGLGSFTQGSYGAGPRVIAIPVHYNVGYRHRGCGCGATGLLGDQTAD